MIEFSKQLAQLKQANLYRYKHLLTQAQGVNIKTNTQSLLNFSSNDYLSLANHPQVKQALKIGIDKYGVGSGASHLISGHFEPHQQLEQALAEYCGQEKSVLFSTGYMANLGVFSALKDDISWALQDKLNHASLIDANQLIGLRVNRYAHNDMASFEKKLDKLSQQYPNKTGLIASDIVFSMDGDIANTQQLISQACVSNNLLLLDGAHSFGMQNTTITNPVTGSTSDNIIYMATLGKAVGTIGAFVVGSEYFINYLEQKSRPYIYTTALPPALCLASLESLSIIKTGIQQQRLTNNIKYFKEISKQYGLNFLNSDTAIQPLIVGDNNKTMCLQKTLQNNGFLVGAIRTPTVPKNTARLRITLNTNHTQSQIEQLLSYLKNLNHTSPARIKK